MTSMQHPPVFSLLEQTPGRLTLTSADGHFAHIFVLEEHIVRMMVLPGGKLNAPRTWAIAPGAEDVATTGRDRFDLSGFSLPDYALSQTPDTLTVSTRQIRLTIRLAGLFCQWETLVDGQWQLAANDRVTQAYNFNWWDSKVYHYLQRSRDEMYFGLGERAGETNRQGSRYRFCNVDPMGYSARNTDPLYKHIPFYLTWRRDSRVAFGLFYDTLSDCSFDMGRELDNYHGHYRYFVADHGDLDYYFIAGEHLRDVSRTFTWLTGRPAMMPRWSIGYSGSTMTYTDAPNAQERMNEFLDRCEKHDILCDSFHLSSGYTSIKDKRYVFNWNRDKFPDPKAFAQHYLDHGVRLCANIKPCLLNDHPRFAEAEKLDLFVKDAEGKPLAVQFWDETGAYLDFTNPATLEWWQARVKDSLLDYGIASTWNDNNEFEIWSDTATVNGFGNRHLAATAKPLHTLMMIRASKTAQHNANPNERPFLISRSGAAGMQRYVQTWSGDNYTSWETLRYNIKMANGLAMSGVSNTGHDIGGFSGPAPEPELFLRWIQHGVFLPRFSIHSWNDDKTVNEPWMYPELTPYIRELIRLRYRLVPYFYNLLWRSHKHYEPMIRPTFHDYPEDPQCFEENDDTLLGANLLVASVVEPGQQVRKVHLPSGAGWYDFWQGRHYAGGQDITLPATWQQPPLLAREGCVIPLNLAEQHFAKPADQRGFAIFPLRGEGCFSEEVFEDDGVSEGYRDGHYGLWQIEVRSATRLELTFSRTGEWNKVPETVSVLLPVSEERPLQTHGATVLSDSVAGGWRRVELKLA